MPGGNRASSVSIRQDLTDLLEEIKFEELNLTAESIAPTVGVATETGRYPVLPREAKMKVADTRREAGGSFGRGQWNWEDDSYITYEYGWEEPVDLTQSLRDEDFISHEEVATERVWQTLLLARESRVASALLNTSTFTGSTNTTAITNEWDDATNATPWSDVDSACKTIRAKTGLGKRMCSVIMSDDLVDYAARTDEISTWLKEGESWVKFVTSGIDAKAASLAAYFGVKEVIVTSAHYDTTGLANSATIGKFWSNEYVFVGILCPPSVNLMTRGVIKQLSWSDYSSDYVIESYEEPQRRQEIVRAREYRGIKVDATYGHLLSNAKTTVSNGI